MSRPGDENAAAQSEVVEKARDLLGRADAVLLDWDGCAAVNDRLLPEAIRFIAENRGRLAIVSNNSTNLQADFTDLLARAGLELPPERVVLAGVEALHRAGRRGAAATMVIGANRMKAFGRQIGLPIATHEADLVVLLRDPRFSYAKLARAANSLLAGAGLILSNPDRTHPGVNGQVVPETGALMAALGACVDPAGLDVELVGKPAPPLFEMACRTLRVDPSRAVMVGDNPATDGAGAAAFGMDFVQIGGADGTSLADLLAQPPERMARLRTA